MVRAKENENQTATEENTGGAETGILEILNPDVLQMARFNIGDKKKIMTTGFHPVEDEKPDFKKLEPRAGKNHSFATLVCAFLNNLNIVNRRGNLH